MRMAAAPSRNIAMRSNSTASELWGGEHPAGERIYLDLWEDYLEADGRRSAIEEWGDAKTFREVGGDRPHHDAIALAGPE